MKPYFFCILLLMLYSHPLLAQAAPVENLIFEGAGIRGLAYAGAVTELENRQLLSNVKRVGGTSAGAITALMLSLGYNSDEIRDIIGKMEFKKFNDGNYFFAGGFNRMRNYYGWYRGQRFESWVSRIIKAKTGNPGITFSELHQRRFKDLYVTGTSLKQQRLIIFSYESYPAMKVKDAIRISMSVPLYFEAVFMDSTGNVVQHPKNKNGLDMMVDGGITGNFPIRIFDSTKYTTGGQPNIFSTNPHTLGFRIDSNAQIRNDTTGKGLTAMPVRNLKEYMNAFYVIVLENLNRQTLTKEDWERTVSISDGGIGPRIKKLTAAQVTTLVNNGSAATAKFFHYTLSKK